MKNIVVQEIKFFEHVDFVEIEKIDDCLTHLNHFLLHADFQQIEFKLNEQFFGHFFKRIEKFQVCAFEHAFLADV